MRLGVDIDGTVKDTHRAAVEVYNRELGKNVRAEDVTEFHLDNAYGLTRQEGRKLWRKLEAEIYSLGVPLPHAPEVLSDLVAKGHEVFFITARPAIGKVERVTRDWLKRHGFPYDGKNLVMNAFDKAKKAREAGVELFFEDAPEHLANLYRNGIPTVVVDAVYNRDIPWPLPRIHDWREVYDLLESRMAKT
ncbi:5' nucleotidase, NT5C type [Staphylospora marina]|uniref:5' nucleotidase, NT5C type n=1 Tax=Staphylospora marina TaxID=2490858 RepID=UPI000F5BC1BF|nr:hypothetical protein [Staphylospora marina]